MKKKNIMMKQVTFFFVKCVQSRYLFKEQKDQGQKGIISMQSTIRLKVSQRCLLFLVPS